MKRILLLICLAFNISAFAQSSMTATPDSVQNISYPGSTGQYTISNPLSYNGTMFNNPPTTVGCINNCKSDYLYFYDFGFNIPNNATITGVQVIHVRGGCNSGSYDIDTLHLASDGSIISEAKRDSVSGGTGTDTLGSSSDTWNTSLTPSIVNAGHFGLFINSTGTGICTFGQFSIQVNVYYTTPTGIETVNSKSQVNIFPNPVSNYLNISLSSSSEITVTNLLGQQQVVVGKSGVKEQLDVSNYPNGIYFIRAQSGTEVNQAKFLVAH